MKLAIVNVDGPMPMQRETTAVSRPFWDALGSATWVQPYCERCDTWRFPPPAENCTACREAFVWRSAPHTGTLYAHTTVHAAPPPFGSSVPYTIGLVDFDHGVRILSPIIASRPAIGDRVEVVQVKYRDGCGYASRLAQAPP